MKLIARLARENKIIKFTIKFLSKPIPNKISGVAIKMGRLEISQLANIFAAVKISKFSQESKICSIVPSSKSFFKKSVVEKIKQESRENQIILME